MYKVLLFKFRRHLCKESMETGDKFQHDGTLGLKADCPHLHFIW